MYLSIPVQCPNRSSLKEVDILLGFFNGRETLYHPFGKWQILKEAENWLVKKICRSKGNAVTGGWRKLDGQQFYNSY